jgi:phenylalanyl-tRNA synthetase beta subunit
VRLTFRAPDRTLTDAEVQQALDAVVAALAQRHDARLRQ